jgi:hypothetical protein
MASMASKSSTAQSDDRERFAAIEGPAIVSDFIEPSDMLDKNRKRILALRAAINELHNRSRETMATLKLPEIENNQRSSSGSMGEGSRKSIPSVALPPMHGDHSGTLSVELGELTRTDGATDDISLGGDIDFDDEKAPPAVPTYATEYNTPRS